MQFYNKGEGVLTAPSFLVSNKFHFFNNILTVFIISLILAPSFHFGAEPST